MWERARCLLEPALAHCHGDYAVEDLLKGLSEGRLTLWVGANCAALTEFVDAPRARGLNIFLAGGTMREFRLLQPGIEAFARGRGATFITFSGRLTRRSRKACGWGRSGDGFIPDLISYRKEI